MKKTFTIAFVCLLTACAGQKADNNLKEKEALAKKPVVEQQPQKRQEAKATNELAEIAVDADGITVTGSRIKAVGHAAAPQVSMDMLVGNVSHTAYVKMPPLDRENYKQFENHTVQSVLDTPISTFSIDVDTGSYANVRRMLNQGQIPRKDAVRVEELINYFSYDYQAPEAMNQPFMANTELAPSPWNDNAHLLHIGIKGYEQPATARPAANLVFLVDVSGSMNSPDKLGLLKSSLKLLTNQMNKADHVAIVVYAGAAGVVLEPTRGNNQAKIAAALDQLSAGGSTNGAAGIHLAYQLAEQNMVKDGINRILVATDGDFNVGTTNFEALKELVEEKRQKGVSLTTLGFGTGNYNDHLMEQLADVGNGNYAYIDTIKEANKVLVEQINSTLFTIAKDVKIQVEFNPDVVSEYRLIGYENRQLNTEDFDNDKVDAGEIGAGHTVTAIYEIVLQGKKGWLGESRYQKQVVTNNIQDEIAFLKIRYKQPDADNSQLLQWPIMKADIKDLGQVSDEFKFAASVAAFGQLLRDGTYLNSFGYDDVMSLARASKGADDYGYRGEFLQLVSLAKGLVN
ncbi:VWA domain-containing protein [Marinicella sp. S1101]|uniref:vWA domain-containing protein n=1 Tax=Marinicella marina TaxID=2996016 RepID=UPI002260F3A4|nr:VWA domain-containing protein [Marinicella marina]MCX7555008.1 VWA domain-containing protein [Marinicella marina]MDJ1141328.1 VWA domain-containing protein [Marinicella marina]